MKLDRSTLKELAEMVSERPTFVTYLSAAEKRSLDYVQKRWRQCQKALPRQLHREFDSAMELIVKGAREKERPFALLVDYSDGTIFEFDIPRPEEEVLVVDNSPYIKPFVRMLVEHPDVIMLVLDHTHARILEFSIDHSDELDLEKDIIGAHKKGGWSQRRYQRLREGAIDHFLKDVEERLEEISREFRPRFILASGPKDALRKVKEKIPADLAHLWKEVDGVRLDAPENSLLHEALALCHEQEETLSHRLVDRLRVDILTHHPASYGFADVQNALMEGRGEVLLVKSDLKQPGMKCEPCGLLVFPMKKRCRICNGETHPVDAVEEMLETAERFDTEVEMVEKDDYLDSLGGIGLLHRF